MSKFREFIDKHDVIFGIIVIALCLGFIVLLFAIDGSIERSKTEGGIVIDKCISAGRYSLYSFLVIEKEGEINAIKVPFEVYYSMEVGDIYNL